MQGRTHHFRWINNAGYYEVAVLLFISVIAIVLPLHLPHAIDNNRTINTGIGGNGFQGITQRLFNNQNAQIFISFETEFFQSLFTAEKSHTTTGNDSFGKGRLRCTFGVFDESFSLFHFCFGRCTNIDLSNTASNFSQSFLKFFAIVFAVGGFNFRADLGGTAVDSRLGAGTADNRCIFSTHNHLFCPPQITELNRIERNPQILEDCLATSEHCQVAHDRFPAVAVSRRLNCNRLHNASKFIHHERCQSFAFHIFGNDNQRLASLANGFEKRHEIFRARNFLLKKKDVWVFKFTGLGVGVSDKMGREKTAIKLHSLDYIHGCFRLLAFFNGDDTILTNLQKSFGKHVADRWVVIASNRCNLHQFFFIFFIDWRSHRHNRLGDSGYSLVNATRKGHRISARGNHFEAFAKNCLGQNGGGSRSVTGHIVGFTGRFLDQLGSEIFERIFEFNVFGNGHAVLCHFGRTPTLIQHRITTTWSERAFYSTGQL